MKGLLNHAMDKISSFFATASSLRKDVEYCRSLLLQYNATRRKYADDDGVPLFFHYYLPWSTSRKKNLNGELKCASAMLLFKNLGGHKIEYSDDNIVALTTPGDLKNIVEEIRTTGFLPQEYINREKEYKEKCDCIEKLEKQRQNNI